MNKRKTISEITNILASALRHKIGSIVNQNEIYAQKYAKDAEILIKEAQKVVVKGNWNYNDKKIIKEELKKKLRKELEKKDFLDIKKFEVMDEEIEKILRLLELK